MTFQTATLTGTYQELDGTPASGFYEIKPNSPIIDGNGNVIRSGYQKGRLDADGHFSVVLPATDDAALEPALDRQYTIIVKPDHSHSSVPVLSGITLAGGSTNDTADLTTGVVAVATYSAFLTQEQYDALVARVDDLEAGGGGGGGAVASVNGETGVVVLDAADVGAKPSTYVPAWSEVTGKPSIPDSPDDIGAEVAGAAATAQAFAVQRANHAGTQTSATISDFTEAAQDAVAAALAGTTGATVTYNDAANTITITGIGDPETMRDTIGAALVGVGNISVVVNDGADTITISTTATVNSTDAALRDRSTHTGTQAASTISDFSTAADARVNLGSTFTGYDVILVAGQSNAVGFGIGVDAIYLDSPDPKIKQWACSGIYAGQVVTALDPLLHHLTAPDSTRIGFPLTFAKDYLDNLASAHRKVLIVPTAVGNTGFTSTSSSSPPAGYYTATDGALAGSWDPSKGDGGFSLYQNAIDRANAAIASKAGNKIVAVLWHQGEGDSGLNQAAYAAKLDALIDGFRANITGASTVPFVIGQMVPDWVSFNPQINAAHADTPNRKTRTAFALGTSGNSNGAEPYHYNAIGQRLLGHSIYTAFAGI